MRRGWRREACETACSLADTWLWRDRLQAQKDKADLKRKLDMIELRGQGGGAGRSQQTASAGFSTWIVLLVAVLAFLLGKYLAVSWLPCGSLPSAV